MTDITITPDDHAIAICQLDHLCDSCGGEGRLDAEQGSRPRCEDCQGHGSPVCASCPTSGATDNIVLIEAIGREPVRACSKCTLSAMADAIQSVSSRIEHQCRVGVGTALIASRHEQLAEAQRRSRRIEEARRA